MSPGKLSLGLFGQLFMLSWHNLFSGKYILLVWLMVMLLYLERLLEAQWKISRRQQQTNRKEDRLVTIPGSAVSPYQLGSLSENRFCLPRKWRCHLSLILCSLSYTAELSGSRCHGEIDLKKSHLGQKTTPDFVLALLNFQQVTRENISYLDTWECDLRVIMNVAANQELAALVVQGVATKMLNCLICGWWQRFIGTQ